MYCPYCGSELPDDAVYCNQCGGKIPTTKSKNQTEIEPQLKQESNPQSTTTPTSNNSDTAKTIITVCIIIAVIFCVSIIGLPAIGHYFSENDNGNDDGNYLSLSSDAKTAQEYNYAMEPTNSAVRTFALNAIKNSNGGNYNIGQICDIYDKLYKSWTYVNDPAGKEYVAKASESVRLLKGDCEDYAILMASCIIAIGGSSRIIVAHDSNNDGHAYAEVYMSDNESDIDSLIKSISRRYGGKTIHYHTYKYEGKTEYWLNLDWTASHPGGKFFEHTGKMLVIKSDGSYYRSG